MVTATKQIGAERKRVRQELDKIVLEAIDPLLLPGFQAEPSITRFDVDLRRTSLPHCGQRNLRKKIEDKGQQNSRRPKRSKISEARANGCDNESLPSISKKLRIQHLHTPLAGIINNGCMRLFKENMSDLYKQSSWGLDLKSKSKELKHCRAHFLVVTEDVDLSREEFNKHTIVPNAADKDQEQKNGGDNKQDKNPILAFLHYRYELDESYDPQMPQLVLYVYELQISHILQRCGVGQRLMNVVTRIALQHNETHKKRRNNGGSASVSIKGIMLTVFTHNRSAVAFYKKKLQFEVAPCSPSFMENEQTYKRITRSRGSADEKRDHSADYEILYKAIR